MYKLSFIPSQLIKFWAIGQYMLGQYFSKVLVEILFTNGWRQPFAKLPILKLSLHNSAAVCLRQKLRRGLPEKVAFYHYTLASLNFTLSVSEYVTTNVTVKPVTQCFCTKQITAVLWSLTCAAVKPHCFNTVIFVAVNHTE